MVPPPRPPYEIATVDEIGATPTDDSYGFTIPGEWKQLRHHFGIREFSANAMVATEAGQMVVHEHFEQANDDTTQPGDEELYVVLSGRFRVRLNDEQVEVGPGPASSSATRPRSGASRHSRPVRSWLRWGRTRASSSSSRSSSAR